MDHLICGLVFKWSKKYHFGCHLVFLPLQIQPWKSLVFKCSGFGSPLYTSSCGIHFVLLFVVVDFVGVVVVKVSGSNLRLLPNWFLPLFDLASFWWPNCVVAFRGVFVRWSLRNPQCCVASGKLHIFDYVSNRLGFLIAGPLLNQGYLPFLRASHLAGEGSTVGNVIIVERLSTPGGGG